MPPYSLSAGYVASGRDGLARRNPPAGDTSFKSFKWHRSPGNCYFSSSCHLLLTPAGLQTFPPFDKSSLSYHVAITNGNTLKKKKNHNFSNLFIATKQVTGASARPYLCSHPQRKKDICSALKNTSFMWKGHMVWVEGCSHERGG